jgi:hypothetical protein
MIKSGLSYLGKVNDDDSNSSDKEAIVPIMLFESPSSANRDSHFFNNGVYKVHDYPPTSAHYKAVLGPCRYSSMNGSTYPSFLEAGAPPDGLLEHWQDVIPGFERPRFVSKIPDDGGRTPVYAYLPCESIQNHVNDPHVHYHCAGKDALPLMSDRTTQLLSCTKAERPCVAKTTHSAASKGIFVIRSDADEQEFVGWLEESGNPAYVVTEFVEIERNVACHFFLHPDGNVTWLGSNENRKDGDGNWSMDSYLVLAEQEELKEMQLPFVQDVVQYCHSLGFWGFMGIDVLFDKDGRGYLVDLNPRVTGSCPSLMVAELLKDQHGFDCGLFRRNGDTFYRGSASQLFDEVTAFNSDNEGKMRVVLFGVCELGENKSEMNIAVYGNSLDECKSVLNHFAQPDF